MEAIRDRKFKKLRKYAAGQGGGGREGGGWLNGSGGGRRVAQPELAVVGRQLYAREIT